MLRRPPRRMLIVGLLLAAAGCGGSDPLPPDAPPGTRRTFVRNGVEYEEYVLERTDYRDPPLPVTLTDDRLDPGRVPEFDPALVHPDEVGGWELNLSRTVFHLDTPVLKPDRDAALLELRATYRDAASRQQILPSVNLIDGKAKQFDDGLYAALDVAYYAGHIDTLNSHVHVIRRIAEALGPDSPAAPFLAAGLELAGVTVPVADAQAKARFRSEFESAPLRSKPLGFYNWSPRLAECYRFLKFFQQPFWIEGDEFPEIPRALAAVVHRDPELRADYEAAVRFYSRLTNPPVALTLLDLTGDADPAALANAQHEARRHAAVAVFPASTSREQRLFDRLFPLGFPEGADLMQELIRAVQSGGVDLAPGPGSGWYDYQTYALETFLLPDRGDESQKLLLTARYKQRMLDAFAALITKRRETHIRQLAMAGAASEAPPPLSELAPRLRLEPNATYYLRTARAYVFLQLFLEEAVGRDALAQISGLREGGQRETDLASELDAQRELFYGFHLLSLEDIGLAPSLAEGELPDAGAARQRALEWLANFAADPDLAVDTRVVVPVAVNLQRGTTQLWGTAGVRLARLDVAFERQFLPSVRAAGSDDEWQPFDGRVQSTTYLIPVDEYISVEVPRLDCPTREEFRRLCDQAGTTERLAELLRNRRAK
ncbi:MAG TPA: hypothetical protein VML55_00700 [Planctomycetaceae bacterium]|nr:hypothetical protein [Planctomycetaceae bacterium]